MSTWLQEMRALNRSASERTKAVTRTRRDEAKRLPRMIKQVESGAPFVAETLVLFKSADHQLSTKDVAMELELNRTTTLKRLWALEAAGLITRISASSQTRWAISSRP